MLDRAKRLSSSPDLFSKECYDLRKMFLKLKYPVKLIDSIFMRFHASQDLNQSCIEPIDSPVLITLPFKYQKSADSVRKQYNCITKWEQLQNTPQPRSEQKQKAVYFVRFIYR